MNMILTLFQLSKGTTEEIKWIVCHNLLFSVLFYSTAPTKSPTITKLQFVTSTALNISWNAPAVEHLHGMIRRYEIFVAKGNCSKNLPTTPTTTISPEPASSKFNDGSGTEKPAADSLHRRRRSVGCPFRPEYNVEGESTHKVISDLEIWTIYSVYVVCWTVGRSEDSNIMVARTGTDSKYFLNFKQLKLNNIDKRNQTFTVAIGSKSLLKTRKPSCKNL